MGFNAMDLYTSAATGAVGTTGTVTALGHVRGGRVGIYDQELTHDDGIGGQSQQIWGMITPGAEIETLFKGDFLLALAARTVYNGLPPVIAVQGDIASGIGRLVDNAYITRCRVESAGIGDAVAVTYQVIGLSLTSATVAYTALAGTLPYAWSKGAATINSGAYGMQSWWAELNNNLKAETSQDVKAANSQRYPEIIEIGNEIVTAGFVLKTPLGIDLGADQPGLPITAAFEFTNGYSTTTLDLRTLYYTEEPVPLESGDATITWDIDCESAHNALSSAGTAAWEIS